MLALSGASILIVWFFKDRDFKFLGFNNAIQFSTPLFLVLGIFILAYAIDVFFTVRAMHQKNENKEEDWFEKDKNRRKAPGGAGSVIVIIATDAPLLPLQCKALAKRVPLGLARTGTTGSHFSGDIFLAFSTANKGSFASNFPNGDATESDFDTSVSIPWGYMDAFYTATVQAVEEAVINALVVNKDMQGRDGHKSYALTHELIRSSFK
jgi:L-aminopeptidase/D-esterase-like protein